MSENYCLICTKNMSKKRTFFIVRCLQIMGFYVIIKMLSEIIGFSRVIILMEVNFMSILEIIGGVVIVIACIVIIVLCLTQEQKSQDSMTSALTGASSDSFYGKNEGRSREAILAKFTRTCGIILFVLTLAINIVPIFTEK